jgi:hypothetical protein
MLIPVSRHGPLVVFACTLGLAGILLATPPKKSFALTPHSPEVEAAIAKGIRFLESNDARDDRYGAYALQGYTLLIFGEKPTHPKIVEAVEKVQKGLGARDLSKVGTPEWTRDWDVYSAGIATIFLVKLDPQKYHADVEFLLAYLRTRQKKHGGWGYVERDTGDTSMTQYGVLSAWVATQEGFNVSLESIESVAGWLLKTQDPSGGFGYQGTLSPDKALVPQSEVRPSMTAAASGSLYICANLLGLIEKKAEDERLPSALKEVKSKENAKERFRSRIDPHLIREAEDRVKKWMATPVKLEETMWVNYYLYALERCMTFREVYEHRDEKEPQWYTEGAQFLMKTQTPAGTWAGQCGPVADTAFGVLFLMRSTKKVVAPLILIGGGVQVGGHGIPKDTRNIEFRNGNVVARPPLGPGADLIASLDKPDTREFDKSVEQLAALPNERVKSLAAKYGNRIRALVGSNSQDARLAAVKFLGKTRDLDNVEALIYALTDPDPLVARAANDGLLRIRRIPSVVPLPENFSEEDRRLLVERWKAWYQSIRPSGDVKY